MASIMKRGNTYSVRYNYKDHAGKPCKGWETFKTKAEAQERKITVEKELLDGTFLVPDTMTVEEMLYKWIPIQSSKHKWSPKTYTQSVAMVQNLIVPYIGKRKVQDLRTYDIEQFYATLSQTPCGQYVHGEKQKLTENQKKRLLSSTSIHEVHTLLKTAFSYAVDWDLIHKSPTPREAPKINTEERTIWDERTMLAALQTIENPALHLAVHMSMILSLREGEILGLQPGDLDFDAADGRGTISVNKALQRADKVALSKIDPTQIYHTFPDRREGSKSSLILKRTKTKKSNRILYMTKPLKEELLAWLEKMKQDTSRCVEVIKDRTIVPELKTILELVRDYDAVLGTAHISPEESFTVVEAARNLGVKKIVVTHPEWWVVGMTMEDQIRMVKDYGVILERCYAQNMGGGTYKSNLPDNLEIIKEVGYKNVMVDTDGGQTENPHWELAIEEYMQYLLDHGIPEEQVYHMTHTIPAGLLGI